MRYIICLAVILLPSLAGFCQQEPVEWSLSSKKISNQQYEIQITGIIEGRWYVYAEDKPDQLLEAIRLILDNDNIKKEGKQQSLISPVVIQDVIFNTRLKVYQGRVQLKQKIIVNGKVPASVKVVIHAFAANGEEFLPIEETKELLLEGGITDASNTIKLSTIHLDSPAASCGDKIAATGSSLRSIFLKGFAGGLIALLMPCIFPMLPVTVSFFMNKAGNKKQGITNGFLYGGFIFLIYLLASIPFHLAGNVNPQVFNIISTNVWVNISFFVVFLLFALSLFGLFELKLPGANLADKKSNAGSTGGVFFMALTLAIVSFSCTGPILGFLLVNSINGINGAWALTTGMAGFGLALALPFGLFAIFPQWLKKLPKSGGWMETLKKSLAFVELALAFKFLSNADLVEHWGILKREVFIGIWLLITIGLGLYLLGLFDKKQLTVSTLINADKLRATKPNLSLGRTGTAILVLLFAAYLVPGLTPTKYANLKWVSGFPPPLSYSIYGKSNAAGKGLEPDVINDYEKALALSKQQNKPLLVDFTGWACVNCRKMEENVWTTSEVAELIKKNFILVSLYVDDREKLPGDKRFNYTDKEGQQRYIKTIGDKWASFQAANFGSASQPQYVILSPDEQLLNHPVGYSDAGEYKEWLQCGVSAFETGKKLTKR